MPKRVIAAWILTGTLLAGGLCLCFCGKLFLRLGLEWAMNESAREFFSGSIRLQSVSLKRDLRLAIRGFQGNLKTRKDPVPVEIRFIESQDPVTDYLFGGAVRYRFEGARPSASKYRGLEGIAVSRLGKNWSFELESRVREIGIEDIEWVNPENLRGSTGKIMGRLGLKAGLAESPSLSIDLSAPEPGGSLQAQFFDLLLPYLPQYEAIEKLKALSGSRRLVHYANANLKVTLAEPDRLKVFLHILISDYNLDLNVNMEIRTDEKNAFLKMARLMGLIEVALS
jgi:hypothetical protein